MVSKNNNARLIVKAPKDVSIHHDETYEQVKDKKVEKVWLSSTML